MKLNRNGWRIWMWETVGRKCKYYNHLWNSRSNSKINVKKRTIHSTCSNVACGIKNLGYEPDCLSRRILPLHIFWVLFYSAHLSLDLSLNMTMYAFTSQPFLWKAVLEQFTLWVSWVRTFLSCCLSDTVLPLMGTYPVQKLLCFSYSIFSPL